VRRVSTAERRVSLSLSLACQLTVPAYLCSCRYGRGGEYGDANYHAHECWAEKQMAGCPLPFNAALLRSPPDDGKIGPGLGGVFDVLPFSCLHDTNTFGTMAMRMALAKELMPYNAAIAEVLDPLFVFTCAVNSSWVTDTLVAMWANAFNPDVGYFCLGASTTHRGYGDGNLGQEGRATCVWRRDERARPRATDRPLTPPPRAGSYGRLW
jgi:hypothetical protein